MYLCCKVVTRNILRFSKISMLSELSHFTLDVGAPLVHPTPTLGPISPPSGDPNYGPVLVEAVLAKGGAIVNAF